MGTGEAGLMIGKDPRTIERWIDRGILRGGRPTDVTTGEAVARSHRWVDAGHAVAYAVGAGRAHLVPPRWQYLISDAAIPAQRSAPDPADGV
jgi:hypothetical protein